MDDATFLQRFETQAWPLGEWHHREHIKLAYLYLRRLPFNEAVAKARANIQAFNAAHKIPEAIDRGYHETMTFAWMHLVHCTLCEFGPSDNADAFVDKHTQLLSKRALLFFYSRDRIKSAEAKANLIEPDLAPLPQTKKVR